MQVKHTFVSAKADGADASLVRPSDWNADHTLEMSTAKVLGRVTAGTGTVEEIDWTAFGRSLINLADVDALLGLLKMEIVGAVVDFACTTVPSGWLYCNGQAVDRTTYAALFARIGTVYGAGNGTTTFNVPDFRGRVAAGDDDGVGRLTTLSGGSGGLGASGGAQTHTLTASQIPAHSHSVNAVSGTTSTDGNHRHGVSYRGRQQDGSSNPCPDFISTPNSTIYTDYQGNHSHTVTVNAHNTNNNTGGGGSHNNVQPTLTTHKCIYAGV